MEVGGILGIICQLILIFYVVVGLQKKYILRMGLKGCQIAVIVMAIAT